MLCVVSCVCSTTNKISPRASSGDYSITVKDESAVICDFSSLPRHSLSHNYSRPGVDYTTWLSRFVESSYKKNKEIATI